MAPLLIQLTACTDSSLKFDKAELSYVDLSDEAQITAQPVKTKTINLNEVDGRSIQTILKDVSTDVLMLALKGCTEKVKDKILDNDEPLDDYTELYKLILKYAKSVSIKYNQLLYLSG